MDAEGFYAIERLIEDLRDRFNFDLRNIIINPKDKKGYASFIKQNILFVYELVSIARNLTFDPRNILLFKSISSEFSLKDYFKWFEKEIEENKEDIKERVPLLKAIEEVRVFYKLWTQIISKKVDIIQTQGNKHLKNIPIHNNGERFYVYVYELNPYNTLKRKHMLAFAQSKFQEERPTEKLLRYDEADPIIGRRVFREKDSVKYPGSLILLLDGHHRTHEIYRRYLKGEIKGNVIVELKRG